MNRNDADMDGGLDDRSEALDDPRLLAALKEFVQASESGRRPSRQAFLARHPEIAAELGACLDGLALVNSAAAQVNAAVADSAEGRDDLISGKPLGDFRLLREIGRGGMGIVYEATQLSLGRRVAVKVLPMVSALDAKHLQRFRNEAQAAAQLHHSNIVPVYAVGSERSVHFYAMQLIEGQSLATVIESLRGPDREAEPSGEIDRTALRHRPPGGAFSSSAALAPTAPAYPSSYPPAIGNRPIRSVDTLAPLLTNRPADYFRTVTELAIQAAQALHYAHQQGVVHRDIKPANLLLDTRGVLWITDFGLAQMYAESGNLTQTGDLLGTLRYMSPEQASGRTVVLDQRTDVYSLGITLYELLTLQRAISGATRNELLAQISSVEPRQPRSIDRRIPVELENIVMKATAKEPSERYPTAGALAEDLRRFLEDKPVLAKPPSLLNKSTRWVRRHKAIAASGVLILLIVSVASTISSVLIAREQTKTQKAYTLEQARASEAIEQRKLAENSFTQARQAVDFFTDVALKEMSSDPRLFDIRLELLETSLAYYQSFVDQRRNDPALTAQLTAAEEHVASVLAERSSLDELFRSMFEMRLLRIPSVQQDLALSESQATAAGALTPQIGRPPAAIERQTSAQIRDYLIQEATKVKSATRTVLNEAQIQRLHEISRQVRVIFALSDADIASTLNLTTAQKHIIRSMCADFHNQHHHGPGFFRGPEPRPGTGEKAPPDQRHFPDGPGDWVIGSSDPERVDLQAALNQVVSREFSPAQAEAWRLLTGAPYTGLAPRTDTWFFQPRHGPDDHGPGDHGPGGPSGDGGSLLKNGAAATQP